METINLKKLAQTLSLSVSTVSKALQDSYEISPETKKRVWELARQLDYVPNSHASSLRRKRSKIIAVVIPEVADSFFSLAIKGIEAMAQVQGYHTLIYLTYESVAKEQTILHDVQSGRVDGVIISLSGETTGIEHITSLQAKGIPVVLFDRVFDGASLPQITTNDFDSGYEATRHLIEQQCRQISFLSVSNSLSISTQRLKGYQKALAESAIPFYPDLIVTGGNDPVSNQALVTALLQRPDRPDGVVASVEKMAIITYQVCEALSIDIPQQLKVISFSNLETAPLLNPPLSTITQPAFEMGYAAANALFKALEKATVNPAESNIMLPSVLVPRASTTGSDRGRKSYSCA